MNTRLFANRAVQLLDKLFQHDEEMATDALDHASVVWEYIESPLHFGHQFGMEDFISHTSTQKDANKRLYSYINNRSSDNIVNEKNKNDIDNNSPQPECPDFIKVWLFKRNIVLVTCIVFYSVHQLPIITLSILTGSLSIFLIS